MEEQQKNRDELVAYISSCIKNNEEGSNIQKMALLAERMLITEADIDEAVESIIS